MAWFRIIEKTTRERQHVECDPAAVRALYPQAQFYLPRRLDREPGEADVFEGGELKRCDATAGRIEADAMLARMSRSELVAIAVQRMRDELIAAGVLPAAER